jgi:hypothetical protein
LVLTPAPLATTKADFDSIGIACSWAKAHCEKQSRWREPSCAHPMLTFWRAQIVAFAEAAGAEQSVAECS